MTEQSTFFPAPTELDYVHKTKKSFCVVFLLCKMNDLGDDLND